MDDIRTETPPASADERTQAGHADAPRKPLREVGPESEVRGGPEAAAEGDEGEV